MRAKIYKSPVAKVGWFWMIDLEVGSVGAYCLTKWQAKRQAKRYMKNYNKQFTEFWIEND